MYERHSGLTDADRHEAVIRAAGAHVPRLGGPLVWVASVDSYEAGAPDGSWIRVEQPKPDLERAIVAIVPESPSGESTAWGVYAAARFDRHPPQVTTSIERLQRLAQLIRDDLRAFHVWAALGQDRPEWLLRFDDHYLGRYEDLHDWLNLEIERAGWDRLIDRVLPFELRAHVEINLASLSHELLASGAILALPDGSQGGVFIFRGTQNK